MTASCAAWPLGVPLLASHSGAPAKEQSVYVSVVDHHYSPVRGLGATDFTVSEDGVRRDVQRVEVASDPMHIALLSNFPSEPIPNTTAFIGQVLKANAATAILLTAPGTWPAFSSDGAALTSLVDHRQVKPPTSVLDAVVAACQIFKDAHAARPVIVINVIDDAVGSGGETGTATYGHVYDALRSANASLWSTGAFDRGARNRASTTTINERSSSDVDAIDAPRVGELRKVLQDGPGATGGMALLVPIGARIGGPGPINSLGTILTSEYRVTYARPDTSTPPATLSVKVSRPGVKVAAPTWAK